MQLGVAVYSMNPQKFKMWQTVLGVNLWKEGVSQKAFKALNRLGLCQSKDAARNRVDKIVEASDRVIQSCKHSLEVPIYYIITDAKYSSLYISTVQHIMQNIIHDVKYQLFLFYSMHHILKLHHFTKTNFVCVIYGHLLSLGQVWGGIRAVLGKKTLCSCHMAPAKPTVCHRVVNFVRTVEHGEGTWRGVERSVNTLVAR